MRLPRVKPVRTPRRIDGNRIRLGGVQYGVGCEILDEDGSIWRILGLMDGEHTIDSIVAATLTSNPDLDEQSVRGTISVLIEAGFVEDSAASVPSGPTGPEVDRYSRNANYFSWIDIQPRSSRYELRWRLKRSGVTILGLGGAGSSMAMSLVAAGIGRVHCVDFGRVEASNLGRQLFYSDTDIGRSKVSAAVERLRGINGHVQVTGEELRIGSADDLLPLFKRSDLVVLCADRPPLVIQAWANEAGLRSSTPWVLAMHAGPMAVVGTFVPHQTPCWRCVVHAEEQARRPAGVEAQEDHAAGNSAAIAPVAALTGHLGALEVIYYLGRLAPQTVGRMFHMNLMVYDHSYYIAAPRWPDCPACHSGNGPKDYTVRPFAP